MTPRDTLASAKRVLRIEAQAIEDLLGKLDTRFHEAVELLMACKGRVVVTGMGKSGLVGRKVAATLASTGTPASFLHPAEALHGDLGMLLRDDAVLAISYSGENEEVVLLLETIKRMGCRLVTMTGSPRSTLARASDVVLDVTVREEACSLNLAPTASTTACMVLGDALAIALLERRGFSPEDFAALHPGGHLGRKLRRVSQVMHSGEQCPRVLPTTKIPDAIYEISKKGLGMTTVADAEGRLEGILTDGDLRRLMAAKKGGVFELTAGECMTRNPVTIPPEEVASVALNLMEQKKITSIVVVDGDRRVLGVVHIHDLWTLQLF
jgi:arabinose-5-phosphate isomerase